MSHSEEHIRVHAKLVDFVCEDLSKKRKLEEQLSIPVSKYKFRTKLCDSERDCNHIEDKLHIHQAYLEDNQFNRLLSREGTVRGEENVVDLLTIDGAEIDSVESIVSAYKTAKVKRHKSVNTASCTREFESGSTTDRHTRHCREEAQLLASGDTNSSVKTSNSQNYVVCHPQSISSTYGHVEASIASTTEIDEELDANTEPYSERQNLNINIMGDTDKTLPLYVLSSGRASRKEEVRRDSKPSTIDQDFEQYFSMLML